MEPLHVYNSADPYALSTLLGELYAPRILYGDSSSGVMHGDLPHYSWALRGNARTDVGTIMLWLILDMFQAMLITSLVEEVVGSQIC